MKLRKLGLLSLSAACLLCAGSAQAFQFETDFVKGSLDSTVTAGFGLRLLDQDKGLVGDGGTQKGREQWSNGDNGNLNYDKGDFYTAYLKGAHDLLLTFPMQFKFMARGTWLWDFAATETARTSLDPTAKQQVARDTRLLDFWVSKEFSLGDRTARIRLGNQVVSWGESLFTPGGINSTNAMDIQKLMVPGTQLKEAVIPAPIASVAARLGGGINVEAYYQFKWNQSRLPPVGTYWSTGDILGRGRDALYIDTRNPNFGGYDAAAIAEATNTSVSQVHQGLLNGDYADPDSQFHTIGIAMGNPKDPRKDGQYGVAVHYKPEGLPLDLGLYFMNYHDKAPQADTHDGVPRQTYLEDRKLYGVSANFPVGNLAVGWEFSYRPKDAIALTGCFNADGPLDFATNGAPVGNCQQWIDREKYQMALTGILALTPGDHAFFLNLLGADTANLLAEVVGIRYAGVKPDKRYVRTVDGVKVQQAPAAMLNFWSDNSSGLGYSITGSKGTEYSAGYTIDFSWVYDGKLIPGWQVTPGITFFHAFLGDTPNAAGTFLKGNMSTNVYLLFAKNPATWQAGLNYAAYFGDRMRQPYRDRDFLGGFVSYNF